MHVYSAMSVGHSFKRTCTSKSEAVRPDTAVSRHGPFPLALGYVCSFTTWCKDIAFRRVSPASAYEQSPMEIQNRLTDKLCLMGPISFTENWLIQNHLLYFSNKAILFWKARKSYFKVRQRIKNYRKIVKYVYKRKKIHQRKSPTIFPNKLSVHTFDYTP